jgi:PAS domain S-box-containing protein
MSRITQALLTVMPDPVVLLTGDGMIMAANRAFAALLGTVPDQLTERPLAGRIGMPEPELREIIELCSRTSGTLPFSAHLRNEKGEITQYRIQGVLVDRDETQRSVTLCLRVAPHARAVQGFHELNKEITSLKREVLARQKVEEALLTTNEALKKHEQALAHLAAIVTSSDDAIISTTLHGIVTSWNKGAERLFGYTAEEMIGQSILRLFPPEEFAQEDRIVARLIEGERIEHYRTIRRRKDGAHVDVSLTISPLKDSQGRIVGVSKIARDITDQKRVEATLRESESFYRQTLESLPGLVFTNWPDGYCDYVSEQWVEFTGVPASEQLGSGWVHVLHPDDRERAYAAWREAVECRGQYDLEYRVRRHDGEYEWFKVRGRAIRNEAGTVVRWFGAAVNVDNLKRTQDALYERDHALTKANDALTAQSAALGEANKELESFSYSVSHDLRAPLRTIDAFSRIVEEDHGHRLDDEGRRCLGVVRQAAAQAGELIDDLLDLSRLGRQSMQLRPVSMTDLARNVANELLRAAQCASLDLQIGNMPFCLGDARLLKRVWMNMLDNAIKYTSTVESPRIEVGWMPDDQCRDMAVYWVKDNGVGFDMKYVHKLYGVFQRLHRKEEFEGTGVGLAIIQRIVGRHGGRVWAEGKLNSGATFYFTVRKAEV